MLLYLCLVEDTSNPPFVYAAGLWNALPYSLKQLSSPTSLHHSAETVCIILALDFIIL